MGNHNLVPLLKPLLMPLTWRVSPVTVRVRSGLNFAKVPELGDPHCSWGRAGFTSA